ncbi:MAG: SHOCT domain-containing protein [Pseudomonadota bacterium]
MKTGPLRALSKQYAAGEIDMEEYRRNRRQLLNELAAEESPPSPGPRGMAAPPEKGKSLGKRIFFWLFGVACALALIVVAWRMPGKEEARSMPGAPLPSQKEPFGRADAEVRGYNAPETLQTGVEDGLPALGPLCETIWLHSESPGQFDMQFCFRAGEKDVVTLLEQNKNIDLKAVRFAGNDDVWLLYGRYDNVEMSRHYAGVIQQTLQRVFPGREILQKIPPAQ